MPFPRAEYGDVRGGAYLATGDGDLYAVRDVRRRRENGESLMEALIEDCLTPTPGERLITGQIGDRQGVVLASRGVVVDRAAETATRWVPVDWLVGLRLVRAPDTVAVRELDAANSVR